MPSTPLAISEIARKLVVSASTVADSVDGGIHPSLRACEKLRPSLTRLSGTAGYFSLFSRALTLARRQAPALEAVRVGPDGQLEKLNGPSQDRQIDKAATAEGVILMSELLGLLVTTIGEGSAR